MCFLKKQFYAYKKEEEKWIMEYMWHESRIGRRLFVGKMEAANKRGDGEGKKRKNKV